MQEPTEGQAQEAARAFGPFGRLLLNACKLLAMMGGLIFVGIVAMSIVSIVGRKVASAPVPGDVELLQMAAAVAGSAFFAYCHMIHGDVKVDFFTAKLPAQVNHILDATGSILVALMGALLTWRVYAGAQSVLEAGETSAILGLSVGATQMMMVPGFALLCLAGLYMAWWNLTHLSARIASAHVTAGEAE
jgi:TRAP-type C4-dicarboxylate transport system permease small subunit